MRTLQGPSSHAIEIKRSRFIAQATRVDTLEETLSFFETVADPAATHNCWAWKIDHQYRFNDDGEPASTAGKPILAAIEGKELDHVMVVVTRHFGGIKLGVGGLIRAYSHATARCLDHAVFIDILPEVECSIAASFCWTGQVYAALESCGASKLEENFVDGGVRIRVRIAESVFDDLRCTLRDATRGEARVTRFD